ncbi:hypothetical protein SCALM49S_05957 [Streptomyces californicus]
MTTQRSVTATSSTTPHAAAQPGLPFTAKATRPKRAQAVPHRLSQGRIRSGLRAVVGSLPVRMAITSLPSMDPPGEGRCAGAGQCDRNRRVRGRGDYPR